MDSAFNRLGTVATLSISLILVVLTGCARKTEVGIFISGSAMHGVHGLAFDGEQNLYGASLTGYSIYRIDRTSGTVTTEIGPPLGNSDDLAFGPDGTLVWTAGAWRKVIARRPDGEIVTLAENLRGVNAVNFSPDGRLFVSSVFGADALYEIDVTGEKPPRLIAEKLGGLNGFEVTADNKLYGPLFRKGKVVQVNLDDGEITDIADGFTRPAAVNIDKDNNLYVVDIHTGEVTRIELESMARRVVVQLEPPLDNLAIDDRGFVYVSNQTFNRVTEINPETWETREIVGGSLSSPGGLAIGEVGNEEVLFIAGFWGSRYAPTATGVITSLAETERLPAGGAIAMSDDYYAISSNWPFGAVFVADRATNQRLKTIRSSAPYELKFLEDGSLLVTDFEKGTLARAAPGKDPDLSIVADHLDGPVGLALDGQRHAFVSEYNSGTILRISLADGSRAIVTEGLNRPEGIAVDGNGMVIVAETGTRRVLALDPATGERRMIAENLPIGLVGEDDLPAPFLLTGIAIGENGAIYVSADLENAVYRLGSVP